MYSCPYSDTISLSAVICIFVLYLFGSWLVGVVVVIYVLLGSIVNYCDVTICNTNPPAWRVCSDVHVMFGGRLQIGSMRSLAGIAKTA